MISFPLSSQMLITHTLLFNPGRVTVGGRVRCGRGFRKRREDKQQKKDFSTNLFSGTKRR